MIIPLRYSMVKCLLEKTQNSNEINEKRIENMLEEAYSRESLQNLKNLEQATKKLTSMETIFENDIRVDFICFSFVTSLNNEFFSR